MTDQNRHGQTGAVARVRDSAILLISQLWPGENFASVEEKLDRQPPRIQAEVTLSVLGYLFLLALFAGQFGMLGLMLYVGSILIVMR